MATATIFSRTKKAYRGPDSGLVRDQLLHLQNLFTTYGAEVFCKYLVWILRKNPEPGEKLPKGALNRRLVPFQYNRIQKDVEQKMGPRNICLKPRQAGYTTYFINRRLYIPAIIEPGVGCLLISQNHHYASSHFRILKRTHKFIGAVDPYDWSLNQLTQQLHEHLLHLTASNRRELLFDQLDSRILCDSAEIEEVGQGITTQHAVCTEVARWPGKPEETLANMKEGIPIGGTLDIESTANGLGGYFYEECMRARDPNNHEKEFTYFFHEWWWHDEYRDDHELKPADMTAEETLAWQKFNLDLNQMLWRRKKMVSLRHNFQEKYPEDDIRCFLMQGGCYFDQEILYQRFLELRDYKPLARFRNGDLTVFSRRIKHRIYVIGADPATGRQVTTEDVDFSYGVCLDQETGEDVATIRARLTPEDFAADLDELGREHNNAMIGVERTGDGGTVILCLQVQHGYGNIYKHREWLRRDQKRTKQYIDLEGFPTTPKTRPIALSKLRWFVANHPELIWDKQFLEEAMRFVRNEKGKPEAAEGSHDDTVSGRWIAQFIRLVNLGYLDPLTMQSVKYKDSPDEDEGA